MRIARIFGIAFTELILLCSVFAMSSAEAVIQGQGLSAQVGLPGTAWSSTLTAKPGQIVNVLITYTNKNKTAVQKYVTIRDILPQAATFEPGSAYLFSPSAPKGAQQANTLTTSGISTGPLKPGQTAYIEFQMMLPPTSSVACGRSSLINKVTGVNRAGTKTYSTQNSITLANQCPTATHTTTTNTTTPVKHTTTVSSTSASTPASASNTSTTTTTSHSTTTTTSSVPVKTTTVSSQSVAAKNTASTKKLVNTGTEGIFGIFAAAAFAGTVFYRRSTRQRPQS